MNKISTDEAWRKFLEANPIIPLGLEKYDHIKVNTEKPVKKCVNEVLEYLR